MPGGRLLWHRGYHRTEGFAGVVLSRYRRNAKSVNAPSQGSGGDAGVPSRFGRTSRLVFAIGLTVFAVGVWRGRLAQKGFPPVPTRHSIDPPVPADLSSMDADLAEAIRLRLRACREQPDSADAIGRLGILYEAHEYVDLAARCYDAAVRLSPSPARWHFHAAVLNYANGRAAQAEEGFRAVIAAIPNFAPAYERLGWILLDRNAVHQAVEAFETVIRLRPGEVAGYAGLGQAHLESGHREKAIGYLKKAIALDPNCRLAHFLLGRAYRELGRSTQASTELRQGRAARPVHVSDPWLRDIFAAIVAKDGTLAYAVVLKRRGNAPEAVRVLEALRARHPNDPEVLEELGTSYASVGRFDEATESLLRAIELGGLAYRVHTSLGQVLAARGKPASALEHLNQAITLEPNYPRSHYVKAKILLRLGRQDEAIDALRAAARSPSATPDILIELAQVLTQAGRFEEAIEALEAAVKLAPDSITAQFNLGMNYARTGRVRQAAEALRKAAALAPGDLRVKEALQNVEARLGNR